METAEEFARKLSDIDLRDGTFQHENPESIALIRERDAAVAQAAKLSVLDELIAIDDTTTLGLSVRAAVAEWRSKHTECIRPLVEADRAAVALSVLRELQSLVQTNKWLDLMGSKEAAWGRAYQEASKQLVEKYTQPGGVK